MLAVVVLGGEEKVEAAEEEAVMVAKMGAVVGGPAHALGQEAAALVEEVMAVGALEEEAWVVVAKVVVAVAEVAGEKAVAVAGYRVAASEVAEAAVAWLQAAGGGSQGQVEIPAGAREMEELAAAVRAAERV